MAPRSYLFVPGDRAERFDKALRAGADAVIVDLEDAVAPAAKAVARQALADWLQAHAAASVLVRINARQTPWFDDDLKLCALPQIQGVVVAKAENRETLEIVAAALGGRAVLPLIETAAGIDALRDVAAAPHVLRLMFGSIDLQVDLGIEGEDEELLYFRSALVLASRLAGLESPVDGVTAAIDDDAAVARDTARARRLGFGAKLCIHPKQVATVHRAFAPSEAEVDWARRVVEAVKSSGGAAVAVDGKMVDTPVLRRAHTLLDRAGLAG